MATPYPIKSGSGPTEHLSSSRLTAERVRRLLSYDPGTGALTWKVSIGRRAKVGEAAGVVHIGPQAAYRRVQIDGKSYQAHRLCFLIYYGAWPSGEIDHLDHDGLNNRIDNLRAVARAGNARNLPRFLNNTSGVTGVKWNRRQGKWQACIDVNGRRQHLGTFDSLAEAVAARKRADRRYDYHPNHGRVGPEVAIYRAWALVVRVNLLKGGCYV